MYAIRSYYAGPELDRLSARGYAVGYAGGGLLLVLNLLWVLRPGWFGMPDELYYHKDHSWARVDGTKVTVGMNDFFQKEAGDT